MAKKSKFTGKIFITLLGEYGVMEQAEHLVDCMNDYDIPGCPGQFIIALEDAFEPSYVLQFVNDGDFDSDTVDPYSSDYECSNPPALELRSVRDWLQEYFDDYRHKIKVKVSFTEA